MENKLGPLIIDLQGLQLSVEEREFLTHPNLGGIILFSRNYESQQQTADLVAEIKSIRPNCLLTVDQEGGRVQRFVGDGIERLPNLRSLGEMLDEDAANFKYVAQKAKDFAKVIALQVRSLGLDLSFVPVLDLDDGQSEVIRNRGFHQDPNIIAKLAVSFAKGLKEYGMVATGKHFPGHGSVHADSHLSLPVDNRQFVELTNDLLPFKQLIEQDMQAIMPGHLLYPNIDSQPASLSKFWLQEVLREQLKFNGAIISDDVTMKALDEYGTVCERAQTALDAGCDMVLICNDRTNSMRALDSIVDSKQSGIYARRSSLLASGAAIPWQHLADSASWNQAIRSLADLNEVHIGRA